MLGTLQPRGGRRWRNFMSRHDEDAALADELKAHHAVMIKDLGRLSGDLANAAASGVDATQAKRALEEWVKEVLFSNAEDDETINNRAVAGRPGGRVLSRAQFAG